METKLKWDVDGRTKVKDISNEIQAANNDVLSYEPDSLDIVNCGLNNNWASKRGVTFLLNNARNCGCTSAPATVHGCCSNQATAKCIDNNSNKKE